ncbi:chorismate lyase [Thiohalobacter sp. IOR34]|uniref:chorismate--pyruvate lyase family protein n=1 Tax=Thiohalobacter sp. IOR34 TaxID=3057176 RepID=UPI0025B14061|nr:chorismate lyase [Thiohalobacter sp. IOR34]WJW75721.1 chorismate lyase [Thiohalobacter sp. IOR34]
MTRHLLHGLHWAPPQRRLRSALDARLRRWLLDPASLTRRLQQACPGRFRVRLEFQGWARPLLDEAQALGMAPRQLALIREVHLLCDERPWVFARTVIPRRTLSGPQRRLARLGERPLGAFLFADPGMRREPVEIAAIPRGTLTWAHAVEGLERPPAQVWGRRSVFRLGGKPLLVSEIFLPGVSGCGEG